jgi:hypothetical protein
MTLSGMSRARMVSACVATLGILSSGGAVAQDRQQFETPTYSTQDSAPLDKGYGLPSFGTPGEEVPKPEGTTTARPGEPTVPNFFDNSTETTTVKHAQPTVPDFFNRSTDATTTQPQPTVPNFFNNPSDVALPEPDTSTSADAGMETPLFTTSQGSSSTDPGANLGSAALGSGSTTDDSTMPAAGINSAIGDATSSAARAAAH